ncbi:peroxiredoxin [Gluconobacter wancherniae]|uniref:thioredoxin-dependent peroxiredoxin n=1 Tax=Gluconobacter wancherniae NBRC 103581 TaxID=656744 RepID=A0A511B2S9_9PROT|nr:peroxiredoxin [Gluconobacter wancherniae]MBF0854868.1 peroxiredoxin [Gluconobacter wancherniae]MBS1089469.1 peroxiredoxin [Gluconobacter wancherniae]GBD57964.1 peroxiredoxin [Gluconobacter wancherniae NBRC 103581]GBR65705.1 thioredoxin peroxidase [Gluconobacter wancherniae NBRC 103581]GEK94745.1 peroxiredoxin [Gluconobacter wancherniae NBRC 103581]
MRRILQASVFCATVLTGALACTPAHAALETGSTAPDFSAPASLGGKEFTYNLAEALKKGPVVLYFYPAAFTKGCTLEAHDFAEAIPDFKAAGASVIGISMDPIAKLDKFSVSECRSAFPVAADPSGKITAAYKAKMPLLHMSSRTSYVIAPDGKVILTYASMSPDDHVARTLAAVKTLQAKTH